MPYYNNHRAGKNYNKMQIINAETATLYTILDSQIDASETFQMKYNQPHFGWSGALRELRNEYTSVELQHEILNDWFTL